MQWLSIYGLGKSKYQDCGSLQGERNLFSVHKHAVHLIQWNSHCRIDVSYKSNFRAAHIRHFISAEEAVRSHLHTGFACPPCASCFACWVFSRFSHCHLEPKNYCLLVFKLTCHMGWEGCFSNSGDWRGETAIYLARELLHQNDGLRKRFVLSPTLCELLLLYPVPKGV